jgi:hypothetical protein
MSRADPGPLERGGGPDATSGTASHHHRQSIITKDQQSQRNAAPPHAGGFAGAWRQGFGRGALDALRCAARRTDDPQVWLMLAQLADEYTVIGDD